MTTSMDFYGRPQATDYEAEGLKLSRRSKLMEALQAQAIQGAMDRPTGTPITPLEAVLRLATVYNTNRNQDKYDERRGAMAGEMAREAQSYADQLGTAGDQESRSKALMSGMMSRNPQIRALVEAERKRTSELDKARHEALIKNARAEDLAASSDPSKWRPKPETHTVGSQVFQGNADKGFAPIIDAREQYAPVGEIGRDAQGRPIIGSVEKGTNKPVFSPQGTNVNVNTATKAGTAFAEALGSARAKDLATSVEKARSAAAALPALDVAKDALNAGIKSGAMADVGMALASVGKAFGLPDDPEVANSQVYLSQIATRVLELVKALRPATDKDVEYAEKAAGGKLTLDLNTMKHLLQIGRAAAYETLDKHETLVSANERAPGGMESGLDAFRIPFKASIAPDDMIERTSTGNYVYRGMKREEKPSGTTTPLRRRIYDPKTGEFKDAPGN